jgi:UDPglucose 6-dehydrogenase
MKVAMIGSGYVGLVSGACFAEFGADVTCIDVDADKIARLGRGEIPIYEPGLDELVAKNVGEGRLRFTTEFTPIGDAALVFIGVGTPTRRGDGHADLTYVYAAAREIARHLQGYTVIVDKSTVPVGTARNVARIIREENPQAEFDVASNPEFLREGAAIADFMRPDRVVIGVESERAEALLRELYRPLNLIEAPILKTGIESAELIKYAANAFLATKISFINEISVLCEQVGADVHAVAKGMGLDGRIGRKFLHAGPGYGGSCFEAAETVFVLNSPHVRARRLDQVFAEAGPARECGTMQVKVPESGTVLAFDLESGTPCLARVRAMSRRPYRGTMVRLRTSMGRSLRVTADHPVVVRGDAGIGILPAAAVAPGDQLLALRHLPSVEAPTLLDLCALLRGSTLDPDVFVTATDDSFTAQYTRYARRIARNDLRYPEEIKRHNRMRLSLFRELSEEGLVDVPAEKLRLYTAKGAATLIAASIPVDGDLLRHCGYYLAEGYISHDTGRAGARRARIGFCFHEDEREYIADVQRILTRWGLKFIERRGQRSHTTVVSSRVFAWLLRDVLACGVRSEDKALPKLAFNVAPELRFELLRGAFSGDGAVTPVQNGRNLMLEYATVSKRLADGMALLMQSLDVVPSIRHRWMNKSTQPAYILRVSGYSQLDALRDVFGGKHRERIGVILDGYERHIRQRGFATYGACVALTVQDVEYEDVDTVVYSMETETGTLVASSGLVCHNCFPKDTQALVRIAQEHGVSSRIVEAVIEVNAAQKARMVKKIRAALGGSEAGKVIAVLGLTFKPETDDMRDAPSLAILPQLLDKGAIIRAHDPHGMDEAKKVLPAGIDYCEQIYDIFDGADAAVLLTEWNAYRGLDLAAVQRRMRGRVFCDLRNVYEPGPMRAAGFDYHCVGR